MRPQAVNEDEGLNHDDTSSDRINQVIPNSALLPSDRVQRKDINLGLKNEEIIRPERSEQLRVSEVNKDSKEHSSNESAQSRAEDMLKRRNEPKAVKKSQHHDSFNPNLKKPKDK